MGKVTKDQLALAKEAIDKIFSSTEPTLELASATTVDGKELVYESLEKGQEVKIGDELAPDGDYVLEDGKTIKVVEGKIAEIVEKEEDNKDDVELATDEGTSTETPETPTEQEAVKLDEVFNLEGLAKVVDIESMQDGYCSVSFNIVDGKMVWGDVYTSDYKTLLSKNSKTEEQVCELKAELDRSKETIVNLLKDSPKDTFVDAPIVDNKEVVSDTDLMKSFLK